MIYRELIGFIEKSQDLSRKARIYRELIGFTEKSYDLPRIVMILRNFLCIAELLLSHPKSEMWPARGKHTPMPPKPWPTSYLFKIRYDLTHSGRLPTCKWHKPQAVIYHVTCTPSIYINNYIFIHIISQCIQHYRLFTEYLYDI